MYNYITFINLELSKIRVLLMGYGTGLWMVICHATHGLFSVKWMLLDSTNSL